MLEIISSDKQANIDWLRVKPYVDRALARFLRIWVPVTIGIVPLAVVSYGYGSPIVRVVLLLFMAGIGWIAFFIRSALIRESIEWQKTPLGWPLLALLFGVLLAAFTAGNPAVTWAWDGTFLLNGPYAWIACVALAALIIQYRRESVTATILLLGVYLMSSTIVALFITIWWMAVGSFAFVFDSSMVAHSLWFALNALVILGFAMSQKGRVRLVWYAALLVHLLVLAYIDDAVSWYIIISGATVWALIAIVRERTLGKTQYLAPIGAVLFGVGLLLLPVHQIAPRFGFDPGQEQLVHANVSWPRYLEHIMPTRSIAGSGLGEATRQFWMLAELVDMRTIASYPPLSNGYLVALWEGGLALILTLAGLVAAAFASALRQLSRLLRRQVPEQYRPFAFVYLSLGIGFVAWSVTYGFVPSNTIFLFTLAVFLGLLGRSMRVVYAMSAPGSSSRRVWTVHTKAERALARIMLILLFAAVLGFCALFAYHARARARFIGAVSTNNGATSVNLDELEQVIDQHPDTYGFRIARVDFYRQSIEQILRLEYDDTQSLLAAHLSAAMDDLRFLQDKPLDGMQVWRLGFAAEGIGSLFKASDRTRLPDDPPADPHTAPVAWFSYASDFYDKAVDLLSRNVILFTDVSRFYRENASILAAAVDAPMSQEAYYLKGANLAAHAVSIDNFFAPARFEHAEHLLLQDKAAEALEEVRPYANNSASASYEAGRIALAAGDIASAASLLGSAISQNPNHLQARYELVQVYLSQDNRDAALEQLNELAQRIPKDDFQSQSLIDGLRELIEGDSF